MTPPGRSQLDDAKEVARLESAGVVAWAVAVLASLGGVIVGLYYALHRTKVFAPYANDNGSYDLLDYEWQHTTLVPGLCVIALGLMLGALAVTVATMLRTFTAPRRAALEAAYVKAVNEEQR